MTPEQFTQLLEAIREVNFEIRLWGLLLESMLFLIYLRLQFPLK